MTGLFRRLIPLTCISAAGAILLYPVVASAKTNLFIAAQTLLLHLIPAAALWAGLLIPGAAITQIESLGRKIEKRFGIISAASAAIVLAVLAWVNREILLSFMNSADEHSCYFMAQYLSAGKLWAAPHPMKQFFETAHIGVMGDKWFSVYPPGWPMVWALGLKLHLKDLLNPILSALSVLWMLRLGRKVYGAAPAVLSIALLMASPFFLLNGAAYYSHNLCLLLMLLFFEAAFKWNDTGRAGWAAWAGLLLGCALAARYLTAAAMGFPATGYFLWKILKDKGKGARSFAIFSTVFLAMNFLHFYYNFKITGSFLDAPNHYLHSHEKLGFIAGYTPLTALEYLLKRILYLIDWTPPWAVILFIFTLFPAKIRGLRNGLLLAAVILLPLAYGLYYSWGGNQYGPRYLFESYPILLLIVTGWISFQWRNGGLAEKKMIAGFLAGILLSSAPIVYRHFVYFRTATEERKAVYAAAEKELTYPALVFIDGFLGKTLVMAPEDAARNSPFLDTPVIYAMDFKDENSRLVPYFPGRTSYRATYDRNLRRPEFKKLS